uniref:Uncharacterized protein n=1 Tax=Lepeophtheirus salmonis TaxID=72036 RepID=A0A0K2TNV6_LEPSM
MKLLILVVCLGVISSFIPSEAKRRGVNCGIACYKLEKCLRQISGGGARPGQLGTTGQLVLNTCDAGECDCEAEKAKKEAKRNKKKSSTTTTTPSPKVNKTSGKSRNRFRSSSSFSPKRNNSKQVEDKDDTTTTTPSSTTTQKSFRSRFRRFNPKRVT